MSDKSKTWEWIRTITEHQKNKENNPLYIRRSTRYVIRFGIFGVFICTALLLWSVRRVYLAIGEQALAIAVIMTLISGVTTYGIFIFIGFMMRKPWARLAARNFYISLGVTSLVWAAGLWTNIRWIMITRSDGLPVNNSAVQIGLVVVAAIFFFLAWEAGSFDMMIRFQDVQMNEEEAKQQTENHF